MSAADDLRLELCRLGASAVEADDVLDALVGLTDLVGDAPAPSAELALLMGEDPGAAGSPVAAERRRTWGQRARRSGAASGVLVLACSAIGATGLSAAANTLPAPLQHRVSEFSRAYLPFRFPAPVAGPATRARSSSTPASRSSGADATDGAVQTAPGTVLAPSTPPRPRNVVQRADDDVVQAGRDVGFDAATVPGPGPAAGGGDRAAAAEPRESRGASRDPRAPRPSAADSPRTPGDSPAPAPHATDPTAPASPAGPSGWVRPARPAVPMESPWSAPRPDVVPTEGGADRPGLGPTPSAKPPRGRPSGPSPGSGSTPSAGPSGIPSPAPSSGPTTDPGRSHDDAGE